MYIFSNLGWLLEMEPRVLLLCQAHYKYLAMCWYDSKNNPEDSGYKLVLQADNAVNWLVGEIAIWLWHYTTENSLQCNLLYCLLSPTSWWKLFFLCFRWILPKPGNLVAILVSHIVWQEIEQHQNTWMEHLTSSVRFNGCTVLLLQI